MAARPRSHRSSSPDRNPRRLTCWFAIIAVGLLSADALGLHFEPVPRLLRVPLHLGFLGATFWLTWRLSGLV